MKRVLTLTCIIAAVMLTASSAIATVYLNCADLGNGVVELSYDSSEETVPVRAFALDVEVSSGIITLIGNLSAHYWIYPGSIIIDEFGEVVDLGSPVAQPEDYPGDTLGGLGTSGMTLEMGSLYVGEANAPPANGVLCTFIVSAECNVNVSENGIRGGVVLEDPVIDPDVYAPPLLGVLPPELGVYDGGTGTVDDPYLISAEEMLNAIGANLGDWFRHFKLVADIDLGDYTETDFNIIGINFNNPFIGTFDGNNHRIHNFTYNCADSDFIGLFGYVDGSGAEIKNLYLDSPNVSAGGGCNVGSLVGYLRKGTISRCCAIDGSISGGGSVGGLVGRNYDGTVINCYARADVLADSNAGGLVGRGYETILNCYSTGNVPQDTNIAGGLVGYNHGIISDSFWDQQTSGQVDGVGGTGDMGVSGVEGKTTAQMQIESTFTAAGWDFEGESINGTEDIWMIREGKTYPRFARQIPKGDFVGDEGVNIADFAFFALAWRSSYGDNNWNPLCDISEPNDGVINERDLGVFVNNWLLEVP